MLKMYLCLCPGYEVELSLLLRGSDIQSQGSTKTSGILTKSESSDNLGGRRTALAVEENAFASHRRNVGDRNNDSGSKKQRGGQIIESHLYVIY